MLSLLENSFVDNDAVALDNSSKQQSMHGLFGLIHPLASRSPNGVLVPRGSFCAIHRVIHSLSDRTGSE
jgi:hypothetical protein